MTIRESMEQQGYVNPPETPSYRHEHRLQIIERWYGVYEDCCSFDKENAEDLEQKYKVLDNMFQRISAGLAWAENSIEREKLTDLKEKVSQLMNQIAAIDFRAYLIKEENKNTET